MATYDYREEVRKDVKQYIIDNYVMEELINDDIADVMDEIIEDCWTADSVTGNGSGSYTFNRWEAEENLLHNSDLLLEACDEMGYEPSYIGERYYEQDFEGLDVLIRCYLMPSAVYDVVSDIIGSYA